VVGRSGRMNRSVEVCSVSGHFDCLLFNYYCGMVRSPEGVGLKLDWIGHRRIGQLLTDLCLDGYSYLLDLVSLFALISVNSDLGTVSGSPEIQIYMTE